MKYMSRKGLAFTVIVLFIGTNVIPSYGSLSSEKSVSKEEKFYDCSVVENTGLSLVTVMLVGETGGDNWYGRDNNFTFKCLGKW